MAEKAHKWPKLVNTHTSHLNMGMWHIYQQISLRHTILVSFLCQFRYFTTWKMAKNAQKRVKMGKNGPKIGQYPDRSYEPGHIAYL